MRRWLGVLIIVVIIFGISQHPAAWSHTVKSVGAGFGRAASGFGVFVTNLTTGEKTSDTRHAGTPRTQPAPKTSSRS